MGLLSVLLSWHAQDPVDDKEISRNENIFTYQGDRNPFVDHPEWVNCLFESECMQSEEIFSAGFEDTVPEETRVIH